MQLQAPRLEPGARKLRVTDERGQSSVREALVSPI